MKFLTVNVLTLLAMTSCGGTGFQSNNPPSPGEKQTTGAGAADLSKSKQISQEKLEKDQKELIETAENDDDRAIAKCLAQFSRHPFEQGVIPRYRKIHASVQVLSTGPGIVDREPTNEPELILISAGVNVLGKTTYELQNPNGWYCLKVNVNVKASTTIDLHCEANLADNKVDVSVLSQGQSASQVGVNVGSEVNIIRTGCRNGVK